MSKILASFFIAAGIFSCAASTQNTYNVTVNFTPDEDGLLLYMVNYDDGVKIDSAVVTDGVARMKGQVNSPIMAQLVLDGARAGSFILEPANITVNSSNRTVEGNSILNNQWNEYSAELKSISESYRTLYQSENPEKNTLLKAIEEQYKALTDSMYAANKNNAIGYRLFLDKAYDLTPAEFEAQLVSAPHMAEFKRIKKLRTSKANEAATSVGQPFKDFTITSGNSTKRLSDYVGKGKWTLVDFWASWCGPCIRETETLKKLYSKYSDSGLDFLGVAVWDEPQNTQKAIEKYSLPWPMIINAQSIPTDIYGIAGIPCIILFDPSGNIVSRGKQGAELIADVEAAMESNND